MFYSAPPGAGLGVSRGRVFGIQKRLGCSRAHSPLPLLNNVGFSNYKTLQTTVGTQYVTFFSGE